MPQRPGAVAESVEHGSHMRENMGSNPRSSQANDLSNLYLLLPSQVLSIIKLGLAQCQENATEWDINQVMVMAAWFPSGAAL